MPMIPDFFWDRQRADPTLNNLTPAESAQLARVRYGVGSGIGSRGLTILHAAARNGFFEAIPKLLTLGIDIDDDNNAMEETALIRAIEGSELDLDEDRDPRVAKENAIRTALVLLDNGADADAVHHTQRTALHEAVKHDLVPVATRLLELGADIHAKNIWNVQPIHEVKSAEMVNLLASRGADVNVLSNYGAPVHKQWNLDTMRALLRHGANPNVKDAFGQTALHNAASAAYYPSVDATPFVFELLQAGADPTIKSESGITAAEEAARDPRRKKQYADGVAMFEEMKGVKLVSEKKNLPPGVESNILGFITGPTRPKAEEGLLFQKLQTTLDYLETVDLKNPKDFLIALSMSAQTLENFGSQVSADIVKSLRALEERAKTVFTSDGADVSELTTDIDAVKARIRTALTTMRSRGGRKTRVRKTKRRKTLRRK